MNKNDVNLDAVFIGPKSENKDVFKENLLKMFDDHMEWRKNFHPEDDTVIKLDEFDKESYKQTNLRMREALTQLSSKLRTTMMPWHSARYLGHMCSETLMPALLAQFATTLYNGNDVTYEVGPGTAELEEEVGQDFCRLMGFDPEIGWGHIASDDTTANLEAVWYMRNMKSFPLAIKEVCPEFVEGKSEWELLNMSEKEVLDIFDKVPEKLDEIKAHSVTHKCEMLPKLGKVIVPQTKHYSWLKAIDIFGIGLENLVEIPVDDTFRMDVDKLKETMDDLIAKKIPIMGVVSVVGTTEEGAVDRVDKVAELKKQYAEQGINFHYHIDSAYGGYGRAMILDEYDQVIPFEKLQEKYLQHGIFKNPNLNWPCREVYEGFKAMCEADTVTCGPHKMGYVPYQAGGFAMKDKRLRNAISYFASYVFQKDAKVPDLLGAFILEGSKAGSAASAVWVAHKTLPLNITGYGRLIGASIEGGQNLYSKIVATKQYEIDGTVVEIHPLVKLEFNMVEYVLNIKGNTNLVKMNALNYAVYKKLSYFTEPYANDLILSHTLFDYSDYGNSPLDLIERCGMSKDEWDKVHTVTLLRSCVCNPFLNKPDVFKYYAEQFDKAIVKRLKEVFIEQPEFKN
ncbi:pyridoxal phosphate-dependent decarboxylase family protein [Clostridium tarantellae]|uniref:Tyrosine decarboxylase n=1 Tax=Clostridium tarantellae TaxID=39493 RepID=A0A6I1MGA2_9CLOT|nr:pyridoxal-dependent decarboxylase [Clostridium tarantellae]MPQ42556.1 tyrosine decarboxylase [Clostridium tarantellae]